MNMIRRKVLAGALRPNWMFGYVVPRRGGGSLQSAACSHLLPDTGLLVLTPRCRRQTEGWMGIIVVWWPGWTTVCEVSRLRHTHARYIYCFAAFWWTSAVKSCGSVSEGKNCQPGETINRPGATLTHTQHPTLALVTWQNEYLQHIKTYTNTYNQTEKYCGSGIWKYFCLRYLNVLSIHSRTYKVGHFVSWNVYCS